jgi:Ca-activated chloride channel family protein
MRLKTLILLYLLIPLFLLAQEESVYKLNVNVDLTEVHVSVTDEKDRPIGSLKKENFHVFEDQTEQKVSLFKHEDIPVSLGLVIGCSSAVVRAQEQSRG